MITKEKTRLLEEMVADLKSVRNATYNITDMSNPWERKTAVKDACDLVHDITEKYKKLLESVR